MIICSLTSCCYLFIVSASSIYSLYNHSNNLYQKFELQYQYATVGIAAICARSAWSLIHNLFIKYYRECEWHLCAIKRERKKQFNSSFFLYFHFISYWRVSNTKGRGKEERHKKQLWPMPEDCRRFESGLCLVHSPQLLHYWWRKCILHGYTWISQHHWYCHRHKNSSELCVLSPLCCLQAATIPLLFCN